MILVLVNESPADAGLGILPMTPASRDLASKLKMLNMGDGTAMVIRCLLLIGWLIVASSVAIAEPDVPAPEGLTNLVVDEGQAETPSDQLAENQMRDPFWPVGYSLVTKKVPATGVTTNAAVRSGPVPVADDLMQRALAMLRVGGSIRRGTNCYATVNGVMVEAGDTIPILVDDSVVLFIVRSVDLKRVRVEPLRNK